MAMPRQKLGRKCKAELAAKLAEVPLFQRCDDEQLQKLACYMKESTFGPREYLMKQHEFGMRFYVIVAGLCDIIMDNKVVGKLTDGDYCGELALIQNGSRTASIRAIKSTRTYSIDKATFKRVLQNDLDITFYKRQAAIRAQTITTVSPYATRGVSEEKEKKVHPSNAETRWLLQAVQSNVLFRHLTAAERRYIVQQMWKVNVDKGTELVKEGDIGEQFYVIRSGRFKVTKDKRLLTYLSTKACFGELALIYNAPRSATVSCLSSHAVLWTIDRNTLRFHVKEMAETRQTQTVRFLRGVPLLSSLLSHEYAKIAAALEEHHFEEGEAIITQGQIGDRFYLIKSGEVAVYDTEESLAESTPLKILTVGAYIGERALITAEKRSATCIAEQGPVIAYSLSKSAFEQLLGPLSSLMDRHMSTNYEPETREEGLTESSKQSGSTDYALVKVSNNLEDLSRVRRIGVGGYGIVEVVREKNTRRLFALKSVRKDLIIRNKQTRHIQSELRVMRTLGHRCSFVVTLHNTYQCPYNVYFLMDLANGGDLFHHLLVRKQALKPSEVQFYIASCVEALSHIHSLNIAYRDLKPENLVIMANGYLSLTDFGLAKCLDSAHSLTYTVCGTPDYLAPESILGRGHGTAVDWWGLGILIYELIAKVPPFMARPDRIADKILSSRPKFTFLFKQYPHSQSLICNLLRKNPNDRLTDPDQLRRDPYFANLDWTLFRQQKLPAPFVPKPFNGRESDEDSNQMLTIEPDPSTPQPVPDASCIWAKEF